MMKPTILLFAGLLSLFGFTHVRAAASGDSPPITTEALQSELKQVRAEIEAAQNSLNDKMKQLRERQQQVEYQDPEIVAIREQLLDLERQVMRKREELNARLAVVPDIKRIEEERRAFFQKLSELRETEAAIQRELAARARE